MSKIDLLEDKVPETKEIPSIEILQGFIKEHEIEEKEKLARKREAVFVGVRNMIIEQITSIAKSGGSYLKCEIPIVFTDPDFSNPLDLSLKDFDRILDSFREKGYTADIYSMTREFKITWDKILQNN